MQTETIPHYYDRMSDEWKPKHDAIAPVQNQYYKCFDTALGSLLVEETLFYRTAKGATVIYKKFRLTKNIELILHYGGGVEHCKDEPSEYTSVLLTSCAEVTLIHGVPKIRSFVQEVNAFSMRRVHAAVAKGSKFRQAEATGLLDSLVRLFIPEDTVAEILIRKPARRNAGYWVFSNNAWIWVPEDSYHKGAQKWV